MTWQKPKYSIRLKEEIDTDIIRTEIKKSL